MKLKTLAFRRKDKLLQASEFTAVFNNRNRAHSRHFTGYTTSNGQVKPRLGLAISKRSAKKAVDRARIKRLIREYFRTHKEHLGGRDFVIMAKDTASNQTNRELFSSLDQLFNILMTNSSKTAGEPPAKKREIIDG